MKRITCPYLGLKDDPTTALNFPSPGNFCHQARPISPVKGSYQERYCLTEAHTACPLYQAAHPVPIPAAIAGKPAPLLNGKQVLALLGIPAIVIAVAALMYAWGAFGSRLFQTGSVPNTGPIIGNSSFGLVGGQAAPSRTPFSPFSSIDSPATPTANCPLPANWVSYTVNPTDSLYRLSVIYGVSVEELQKANCMGSKTVILPGQVIYVPFIPTNTPISTDTTAPQRALPNNTPQPTATATNTKPAPTAQATSTDTALPPTATATSTNTATSEPTGMPTATATTDPTPVNPPPATATDTPQPTPTHTNPTPAPTSTSTPVPTATDASRPTPQATATSTTSSSPTAAATSAPSPTAANTSAPQPTQTATQSSQPIETPTNTPQPSASATNTTSPTETATSPPQTQTTTSTAPTATATATPQQTAGITLKFAAARFKNSSTN